MKLKTSELTGAALDWAVAKCEGMRYIHVRNGKLFVNKTNNKIAAKPGYSPSTRWAQGGPIIEREKISTGYERYGALGSVIWDAVLKKASDSSVVLEYGPTPLIAAMRCYVASKLGEEVEVPDELAN